MQTQCGLCSVYLSTLSLPYTTCVNALTFLRLSSIRFSMSIFWSFAFLTESSTRIFKFLLRSFKTASSWSLTFTDTNVIHISNGECAIPLPMTNLRNFCTFSASGLFMLTRATSAMSSLCFSTSHCFLSLSCFLALSSACFLAEAMS